MVVPKRSDRLIVHLMEHRKAKNKKLEAKEDPPKPKDPEDTKKLIEMWQKMKEKKK